MRLSVRAARLGLQSQLETFPQGPTFQGRRQSRKKVSKGSLECPEAEAEVTYSQQFRVQLLWSESWRFSWTVETLSATCQCFRRNLANDGRQFSVFDGWGMDGRLGQPLNMTWIQVGTWPKCQYVFDLSTLCSGQPFGPLVSKVALGQMYHLKDHSSSS